MGESSARAVGRSLGGEANAGDAIVGESSGEEVSNIGGSIGDVGAIADGVGCSSVREVGAIGEGVGGSGVGRSSVREVGAIAAEGVGEELEGRGETTRVSVPADSEILSISRITQKKILTFHLLLRDFGLDGEVGLLALLTFQARGL